MCGCVHVSVGVCARDRFCACLKEGERHKKRTGDRERERARGRLGFSICDGLLTHSFHTNETLKVHEIEAHAIIDVTHTHSIRPIETLHPNQAVDGAATFVCTCVPSSPLISEQNPLQWGTGSGRGDPRTAPNQFCGAAVHSSYSLDNNSSLALLMSCRD